MGNRRNVNVDGTTTRKSKKTRGKKAGRPADPLSARSAQRQATSRKDTCQALLSAYNKGHVYSEEEAISRNAESSGYYVDHICTVMLDPEDACEIFCHHNYAGQRSFDQAHSTRLASSITTAKDIDMANGS